MASRRRPFLTLFIIALLGLAVYDAWQVRMLRAEVTDLKHEVAALRKGDTASVSGALGSVELLTKARKHADLARKYIADGEFKKAKAELDASLELTKRVGQMSGESSKDALEQLRETWRDAGDSIERMWHGITEKSGGVKNKGG